MVKEHPITFSGPLLQSILDGEKAVTRRLIRFREERQPVVFTADIERGAKTQRILYQHWIAHFDDGGKEEVRCPFGIPGDHLWVRENYAICPKTDLVFFRATDPLPEGARWQTSRFMKKEYHRLRLELTDIAVTRLQAGMTEPEVILEGVRYGKTVDPVDAFRTLWDQLHGDDGSRWDDDPWVWRLSFDVSGYYEFDLERDPDKISIKHRPTQTTLGCVPPHAPWTFLRGILNLARKGTVTKKELKYRIDSLN